MKTALITKEEFDLVTTPDTKKHELLRLIAPCFNKVFISQALNEKYYHDYSTICYRWVPETKGISLEQMKKNYDMG